MAKIGMGWVVAAIIFASSGMARGVQDASAQSASGLSRAQLIERQRTLKEMERLKYGGQLSDALALADSLHRSDQLRNDAKSKQPDPALFQSSYLGAILHALGADFKGAIALYRQALVEVRKGMPIDDLTRSRIIAGLVHAYEGVGERAPAIAFLNSIQHDAALGLFALPSTLNATLCRLYMKEGMLANAHQACLVAQQQLIDAARSTSAEQMIQVSRVQAIRNSIFEIGAVLPDTSTEIFKHVDQVGSTAFSKPAQAFLHTQSPFAILAKIYREQADESTLLSLYEGAFRQYAQLIEQALAHQASSGHAALEDDYAMLGAHLGGAHLPQAEAALRRSLRLNGDRVGFVATQYNPQLLAGTLATRRAKAGLYASLVLRSARPTQAALSGMAGELMQGKGVQSEILAIRHKAIHASGDRSLIALYNRAEAAAASGNELEWKTAVLALGTRMPAYLAPALYDDGDKFLQSITQRLGKQTLVSVVRYQPFDFGKFAFSAPRYLAVRVAAGAVDVRDIGTVDEIDLMVQRYRAEIAATSDVAESARLRVLARALYQAVLAPVLGDKVAPGDYVIDLDGMVNLLPLEALRDGSDRCLLDAATWRYISSARTLLRDPAPARAAGNTEAVLVFNPAFDAIGVSNVHPTPGATGAQRRAAAAGRFVPLPETAEEGRQIGRAIARMGMKVTVLAGALAEARVIAALKAPRFLHIATHGFYVDDQFAAAADRAPAVPQRFTNEAFNGGYSAGIALAGANAAGQGDSADGLFFLSQFRMLDLNGTELVVLSACDTALGSVRIGEGVNSLRQSLELAGARWQVTALWKVPSHATASLMAHFYASLARGHPATESLRQAKMAVRKSAPNALYWAGFTLSGSG